MRILNTEITPLINSFLHVELRKQQFLSSPYTQNSLHSHPELELVFILKGFGKRIIANKVESFEPGDMVLIGSSVPHVWLSDSSFYQKDTNINSKVIITYFNSAIFQQFFDTLTEFSDIKKMILESSRGIRVLGKARNIIAEKLIALPTKKGFEKIDGFLQIMHLISITEDKVFVTKNVYNKIDLFDSDRLINVIKFVESNIDENITLKKIAQISNMTEQSFCRFFKKRTKKSFFRYLEDIRMSYACELLLKCHNKSISDIAFESGYKSSSRFCEVFRSHYGQSPLQYKKNIELELQNKKPDINI